MPTSGTSCHQGVASGTAFDVGTTRTKIGRDRTSTTPHPIGPKVAAPMGSLLWVERADLEQAVSIRGWNHIQPVAHSTPNAARRRPTGWWTLRHEHGPRVWIQQHERLHREFPINTGHHARSVLHRHLTTTHLPGIHSDTATFELAAPGSPKGIPCSQCRAQRPDQASGSQLRCSISQPSSRRLTCSGRSW